MVILARNDSRNSISVKALAEELKVSADHLAKVMQRLAKHDLVRSSRGPSGGYTVAVSPEDVSMLDIYESIEGPRKSVGCVLGPKRRCAERSCIFGDMLCEMEDVLSGYMIKTKLADAVRMSKRKGRPCGTT